MKHFMDIVRVKESNEDGMVTANTGAFEVGDRVVFQSKMDGSNAHIEWEDGELKAFSRKKELNMNETLRGFWNYVQTLDKEKFRDLGNRCLYGEWLIKNVISYDKDAYNKWYIFDMYDKDTEQWLPQEIVKKFAEDHDLIYVNTYYDGPFISWEHVRSFLDKPVCGDKLEGIVAKNMTKLNDPDCRNPFYLKIVNDEFCETKINNHIKKILDPQHLAEKATAEEMASQVVTEARVRKDINKQIDEGLLSEQLTPRDMATIARNLPQRIYNDIVKEESDLIGDIIGNQFFGKAVSSQAMNWAKKIILGA